VLKTKEMLEQRRHWKCPEQRSSGELAGAGTRRCSRGLGDAPSKVDEKLESLAAYRSDVFYGDWYKLRNAAILSAATPAAPPVVPDVTGRI